MSRDRVGLGLIVFGGLAWVPYFGLIFAGDDPAMLPYLAWHLTGVIPGTILRGTSALLWLLRLVRRRPPG